MNLIILLIIIGLLQYILFMMKVGGARGKLNVPAPAVTGNEQFERLYRIQMNTMEQLILFIPGMYLFATYTHILTAQILGVLYIIGRFLYARSYAKDPKSRTVGALMSILPNFVLIGGALVGILLEIFT
ncbi:MAPEG family protein [Pseudomaricurvus alkylphenolicus]|jgi:hypothetical protein|uniref:MAPEG family protein n=1 Tax=Pseudomaricurvus alkylphenolicus TaxID=1306991 RepID=UPI00142268FA|nr:MAPEG family protein [Pseudomaricurvus alkylphenolicus]NIB44964.1 MAPEG family protein [Pseudomaricurvus alkylphenolicus]